MDSSHDHHAMHSGHDMHGNGHDPHAGHDMHGSQDMITAVTQNIAEVITKAHQHVTGTASPSTDHSVHNADHSSHSMGSMTFHGGYKETVLFSWWNFDSLGGLFASIFVIFIVSVLYEGLKYYREYLFWSTNNSLEYRVVQPPEEKASAGESARVVHMVGDVLRKQPPTMLSKIHLWQTVLHGVQVTVSYLLMLIFMTYNSWLCLAVVAGAACGNFLFGWKKSIIVDVTEHCH